MAWIVLAAAGLLEIVWAVAMKQSAGFTRPLPTVVMVVAMAGSVWLLASLGVYLRDLKQAVGIVTMADFMRLANLEVHEGMGQRLRSLIMGRPKRPDQVQGLMSSPVLQVQADQHVMDLVPLFSEAGHHHIPVVDEARQLVGIITQSDLVKALAAAVARS